MILPLAEEVSEDLVAEVAVLVVSEAEASEVEEQEVAGKKKAAFISGFLFIDSIDFINKSEDWFDSKLF